MCNLPRNLNSRAHARRPDRDQFSFTFLKNVPPTRELEKLRREKANETLLSERGASDSQDTGEG